MAAYRQPRRSLRMLPAKKRRQYNRAFSDRRHLACRGQGGKGEIFRMGGSQLARAQAPVRGLAHGRVPGGHPWAAWTHHGTDAVTGRSGGGEHPHRHRPARSGWWLRIKGWRLRGAYFATGQKPMLLS